MAAKPSRAALSSSWSAPLPRPSWIDPRMVNGPTQKTSELITKPWMNRALPS